MKFFVYSIRKEFLVTSDVVEYDKNVMTKPMTEQDVAELLDVSKAQAKSWLVRLVKSGSLEKLKKPVRYQAVGVLGRLL